MQHLTGADAAESYANRLDAMVASKMALWDVLRSCVRPGSLDSEIRPDSIVANDFREFFRQHPRITQVCFNGAMAEQIYCRKVLPALGLAGVEYLRLPSTSPAYTIAFDKKLAAWQAGTGRVSLVEQMD